MEQEDGGILKSVVKNTWKNSFQRRQKEIIKSNLVKRAREEQWNVWSLDGGLELLVETFSEKLKNQGVKFNIETPIETLKLNSKSIQINELTFDHAFLTTPAHASAKILSSASPDASVALSSIPFVDVAVVTVEFGSSVFPMDSFGFLVPSDQPDKVLGVIFDTCPLPQGRETFEKLFLKKLRTAFLYKITQALNLKK